jgi:RND family efflux transporter MFP subunit
MKSVLRLPLSLLAAAALAGCGREPEPEAHLEPTSVQTVEARAELEPRLVEAVGTLRSARQAVLAGKVMGTIVEIRKGAGDRIRRGEVLIVIDGREVAGQIAQAEGAVAQARAAAVLARANFTRFDTLFARGSASQLELDQARWQHETAAGAVAQAEGALATARSYQSYASIPAPFDGHVVDRMCEIGDLSAPGRPLMTVEDASHLRLHVTLSERETTAAVPGALVRVRVPALGDRDFEGRVAEVVPAVDPVTRSFTVKIDVQPDSTLRSGLYAQTRFEAEPRRVLRLPAATLVQRGGLTGVLVAEDGRATFRIVTVAQGDGEQPEILSGLAPGEQVIVPGRAPLAEGTPVLAASGPAAPPVEEVQR